MSTTSHSLKLFFPSSLSVYIIYMCGAQRITSGVSSRLPSRGFQIKLRLLTWWQAPYLMSHFAGPQTILFIGGHSSPDRGRELPGLTLIGPFSNDGMRIQATYRFCFPPGLGPVYDLWAGRYSVPPPWVCGTWSSFCCALRLWAGIALD